MNSIYILSSQSSLLISQFRNIQLSEKSILKDSTISAVYLLLKRCGMSQHFIDTLNLTSRDIAKVNCTTHQTNTSTEISGFVLVLFHIMSYHKHILYTGLIAVSYKMTFM